MATQNWDQLKQMGNRLFCQWSVSLMKVFWLDYGSTFSIWLPAWGTDRNVGAELKNESNNGFFQNRVVSDITRVAHPDGSNTNLPFTNEVLLGLQIPPYLWEREFSPPHVDLLIWQWGQGRRYESIYRSVCLSSFISIPPSLLADSWWVTS